MSNAVVAAGHRIIPLPRSLERIRQAFGVSPIIDHEPAPAPKPQDLNTAAKRNEVQVEAELADQKAHDSQTMAEHYAKVAALATEKSRQYQVLADEYGSLGMKLKAQVVG